MSLSVRIQGQSNKYLEYNKKLDTPIQANIPTAKKKKHKDQETTFLDNEMEFKTAKGIINALILCTPFWILVIMFFIWLM